VLTPYKGLMIILDGLGDRGIPRFGGMTPLESADTPTLDALVGIGQCGLIDPLFPGMPVDTHTGMSLLFGLPRRQALKLPRGPVEASGIGIGQKERALYIRCNFATLKKRDGGYDIIDRRAGRKAEGLRELAADAGLLDLGDGIQASLHPTTHHRAVLKLVGEDLSPRVSNTDPGNHYRTLGVLGCTPLAPPDEDTLRTAAAINRFTDLIHERFSRHPANRRRLEMGLPPANGVICRSPGKLPKLRTLLQQQGVKAAVISGEETVLGLGSLFDYSLYRDPAFTALPDTDLRRKVVTARNALEDHDLVFLHIKGPDICSHDLDPLAKRRLLTEIDNAVAPLVRDDLVIAVTGDHSTDSNSGRHTGDPVPGLIHAPGGRQDNARAFGEASCCSGGLGRIDSSGFLVSLLDHMNRLENFKPEQRHFFL